MSEYESRHTFSCRVSSALPNCVLVIPPRSSRLSAWHSPSENRVPALSHRAPSSCTPGSTVASVEDAAMKIEGKDGMDGRGVDYSLLGDVLGY